MKFDKYFHPPTWFSVRSPQQEDAIDAVARGMEEADEVMRIGMEKASLDALPHMAEVVRDLDSLDESRVRGGTRVWTHEAYERVQKSKRRKKFLSLFQFFKCPILLK